MLRALKILVGLGLLGWLLSTVEFDELLSVARRGEPALLVLGIVMLLVSLPVLQAWRLHVLIASYTQSVWTTLRIFFVGAFFNNVLPSNVGGDAVRLLYLQRLRDTGWGAPLALLLLHRVSGIAVILVVALLYAPFDAERIAGTLGASLPSSRRALLWVATLLAMVLAGVVAARVLPVPLRELLRQRAQRFIRECSQAVRELPLRAHAALVVLTLGYHLTRLLGFYYVVRFMGESVGAGDLIMVMAVTAVVALVPITVGALGVMEGSITVLLGLYGVSATTAVAVALTNRFVLLLNALVGGVLYVTERQTKRDATTQR